MSALMLLVLQISTIHVDTRVPVYCLCLKCSHSEFTVKFNLAAAKHMNVHAVNEISNTDLSIVLWPYSKALIQFL